MLEPRLEVLHPSHKGTHDGFIAPLHPLTDLELHQSVHSLLDEAL